MQTVTVRGRARPGTRRHLFTGGCGLPGMFPPYTGLSLSVADLMWNDPKTADVNLILQDLTVIETHRVRLTFTITFTYIP